MADHHLALETALTLVAATVACSSGGMHNRTSAQARRPTGALGFFVTSVGVHGDGNLGGLAGADAHCQALAEQVGAGGHTWRAYLSAGPQGGRPQVDARDRIGDGPWYNARGALIARDLDELHSDRSGLGQETALTERGEVLAKVHDVITGSDPDGRLAELDGAPATCGDWTSTAGKTRVGHSDRMDAASFENKRFARYHGSWSSEHDSLGCSAADFTASGGAGLLYCFAADPAEPAAPRTLEHTVATYRRGLNVNHWLGDNFPPEILEDAHYGADWFDEEDVGWIAAQGFDHLRIWVSGHQWIDQRGQLVEAALKPFDDLLGWARRHHLGVILLMHSVPGHRASMRFGPAPTDVASPFSDEATRADAAYLWWLVARRYQAVGDGLRFDVLNEPDVEEAELLRGYQRAALAAIRRVSPERVVYLAAREMAFENAGEVDLSDPNTMLAVEYYEPSVFTWQLPIDDDTPFPEVPFPGRVPDLSDLPDDDPQREASGKLLSVEQLDRQIEAFARALPPERTYVARIGVYHTARDEHARRYIAAVRAALERNGFTWAVYDYHTGCAVRGRDGRPTRIIEGLALEPRDPGHP